MNVLDKLSILSAIFNCERCERCDNCIARGYCNTIRNGDYIIEIISDVRELLKAESHDD